MKLRVARYIGDKTPAECHCEHNVVNSILQENEWRGYCRKYRSRLHVLSKQGQVNQVKNRALECHLMLWKIFMNLEVRLQPY